MPKALLVEIEAKTGSETEIADFLRDALRAAEGEPHTRDWYALRFDDRNFAIFDTFDGSLGRLKHLAGSIGRGLVVRSFSSLQGVPDISTADLVAAKLPTQTIAAASAIYVPIETKLGQGRDFGEFLLEAKAMVDAEPATLAWYAVRTSPNGYAIVGVFADDAQRTAHLEGPVGTGIRELIGRYLETMPEIRLAQVLACKQSGWTDMVSAAQEVHAEQAVRISPEPV